nr:hypothetical protein [Actinomadura madurae]
MASNRAVPDAVMGVSTSPGCTAFTRTPRWANSRAAEWVRLRTPHLLAA